MEVVTKSANETKKLGKKIGDCIKLHSHSVTVGLKGDLGAGKTTFAQGFAEGIGIKSSIVSPTFILMREYKIPYPKKLKHFYHIDLYRLQNNIKREIENLGIPDLIKSPGNILLIEWVEKAQKFMPKEMIKIELVTLGENERKIKIKPWFKFNL